MTDRAALDETDSAKVIAYILELSSVFDNQLLGKAFVARTIKEASNESDRSGQDKSGGLV